MRNQAEIVEKIREYQNKGDFFGVKVGDAIAHLDFTHAKEFLKPEVTEAEWNNDFMPLTREAVLKQMEDYMPFAWEKANGMRGISANRN